MLYDDLLKNGFIKIGNWMHKDAVSINLLAGILEHTSEPRFFFSIKAKSLTINEILAFKEMMEKLIIKQNLKE